jgi:hypothetical protein
MVFLLSLLIAVMGHRGLQGGTIYYKILSPFLYWCKATLEYFLVGYLNKYGYLIPWTCGTSHKAVLLQVPVLEWPAI